MIQAITRVTGTIAFTLRRLWIGRLTRTGNFSWRAKLTVTAAAVALVCTGCHAAQPVEVPSCQTGTVPVSAAMLRCDEEWYLEADRTEKNLPAVRLNSAQTDETVAMAALESDGEIADAIYENGLFYIAVTQPAEKEENADYMVYRVSNADSEPVVQGACGNDLAQAPAFAQLQDGTVLVVQDQNSGLGLYLVPEHASESVQKLSAQTATLISVTPKIHQNRIALFAEGEAGTRLLTYEVDFSAGEAALVSEIPLEQGAEMTEYALAEDELMVCQQTAASAGTEPEYEVCVYQLATGELVQRESLGEQPVYPICGLQSGGFLCQDAEGTLFAVRSDSLQSRQVLDQMGEGPFAAACSGVSDYLVNADGEIYAVDAQPPAQTAPPTAAPELSYAPDYTSENQYVNENGIQVLTSYKNDLLPMYQAEMIYAVFEPETDRFRFQLSYLQDGRRYFLESSFRWSDRALLAYSVHENQQAPDAALPAAVLQPLTEQQLLSIAQTLYDDLAAHCNG